VIKVATDFRNILTIYCSNSRTFLSETNIFTQVPGSVRGHRSHYVCGKLIYADNELMCTIETCGAYSAASTCVIYNYV